MAPSRRFIFRAQAVGVASHIRRPGEFVLPVQASCCLPVTGGWSKSRVVGKRLKGPNHVTFELASTSARGDHTDLNLARAITLGERPADSVPTRTSATAYVRDLHIVNRLRISAVHAGMVAHTDVSGRASFQLVHTSFTRVQVGRSVLKIELATDVFNRHPTLADLAKNCADLSPSDRKLLFPPRPTDSEDSPGTFPESRGVVFATIVRGMTWEGDKPEGSEIKGNALILPNFGKVYFGELLIAEYSRRLTMVRCRLGSAAGGDCSAAEVETQGSTWP